jgi:CMP-N,N'-diacetyllegionaminic acid synthase
MKVFAVIPARGGSKGFPGKNIIDFCGKPLIAWSIEQALETKEIDSVYVTSDSDEILSVARGYGAKVIVRPAEISGDTATSESAVEHALKILGRSNADAIILMQPTSPLRKPDDLGKAVNQFVSENLDSLFSGAVLEDFLIWERKGEGFQSFNYDYKNRGRRQERLPQYVENGSFYISKPDHYVNNNNRLGGKIGVYLMDFWQSFEVDTPDDLKLMQVLFETKIKSI